MKVLSVSQMKRADEYTIANIKSEEDLIFAVGNAVADEIRARFSKGKVLCCLGKGNNGKDGEICASALEKSGFSVVRLYAENPYFSLFNENYDIVLDALFGTGLNREVSGEYKKIIGCINDLSAFKISIDIPSGLDGDNGLVLGECVKADLTLTVQAIKSGLILSNGKDFCGEIKVVDAGIVLPEDDYAKTLSDGDAKAYFLPRKNNVNKGNFGKVAVVGGRKEYSGSVLLALNSLIALKSGTGYANLTVPKSIYQNYFGVAPECTFGFLSDDGGNVVFDKDGLDKLLKYDSICFGMGMGVSSSVYESISYLLANYSGNLLIDADGLNSLSEYGVEILKNKKCTVVLTPHVKEFSRLSGKTVEEVLKSPITLAEEFAREFGVTVVLKSCSSVITDGRKTFINTTGTNALSKGGSGDALSGFIAGMLVRIGDTAEKVSVANYVYGKSAEIATANASEYTVTATDVIACLPKAIKSLF